MGRISELEYYNKLLHDVEPKYSYKIGDDICDFQKNGKSALAKLLGIEKIQNLLDAKERTRPFLWIPRPLWKVGVLIVLTYILIEEMIDGDFFAIPAALIMYFCGFFIFAGYTTLGVAKGADDPNKKGSPAWKKANGVEQVGFNIMNPLWRDKYGNYYKGTNYVPITPPVNVVNKNK
jgi:hypothetical protein